MKKNIFTAIIILTGYVSVAQITINRADFGNIGNKYYYASDTTVSEINIGAKGLNASWDFSTVLKADKYDSTEYVDPINLPGYPEGSNIATVSSNGEISFLSLTNSDFKLFLSESEIPFPLTKNTLTVFKFPLKYLDANQDEIKIDVKNTPSFFGINDLPSFIDSIRIVLDIKAISLVDGAGSLKTPTQTYESVLRMRLVNNMIITSSFRNSLTSTWSTAPQGNTNTSDTSYSFFGTNSGSEIMSLTIEADGKPSEMKYRIPSFNPTNLNELFANNSIQVYPNPANENLTIFIEAKSKLNANVTLVDLSGKEVKTVNASELVSGNNFINIPTNDLKNGIYFCNILIDGVKTVKKVAINN